MLVAKSIYRGSYKPRRITTGIGLRPLQVRIAGKTLGRFQASGTQIVAVVLRQVVLKRN